MITGAPPGQPVDSPLLVSLGMEIMFGKQVNVMFDPVPVAHPEAIQAQPHTARKTETIRGHRNVAGAQAQGVERLGKDPETTEQQPWGIASLPRPIQ